MPHLDYTRLKENTDHQLHQFLTTVIHPDTKRRCQAAFPEFFQDESILFTVDWSDLVQRYQAVSESDWLDDWEDDVKDTFSWFGITIEKFEYRRDGIEQKGYRLLSSHLAVERDDKYDGMMSRDNQWFINLPKKIPDRLSENEEYLVLKILITGEDSPAYFIWAVPTWCINFKE